MDEPASKASAIGSVDNALRLLMAFEERDEIRVADLSRMLGVARSTAHRLLRMLTAHGFVTQDQDSKAYVVGPALMRLAVSISRGLDLTTAARPIMAELVEEIGETGHLAVLRGEKIFFLDSIETTKPLRVGARVGHLLPAYATASGRVLLSELTPDELHRIVPPRMPAVTARTVTERTALEKILAETRDRGYASSLGESEEDVASVAVPIRHADGRIAAALAVAAPPSRLTESDVERIAAALSDGARRIGALLP